MIKIQQLVQVLNVWSLFSNQVNMGLEGVSKCFLFCNH